MKKIWIFILFIAFGCQQSTVNSQQTSCFMSTDNSQQTTDSVHKSCTSDAYPRTVDRCPLSVDYFESQIRLADSLYKNYLPQYNFEEVKAAMMFFDSLRLTTDNSQRTTDFLESENLKNSESEKGCEQRAMSNEPFSKTEKSVNISEICGNEKTNHRLVQKKSEKGCEPRAMSNEPFLESEKSVNISEICGNEKTNHRLVQKKSEKGCEQRAMSNEPFLESENLKTSESEKSCEPRAMSNEQRFRKAQSSQLEAQSPSQVFRGVGILRARFYIGFTNLVYNMCRLVQIKRYHPDWIIN